MAKILIIEDDGDLVETFVDLLENGGHSVVHTSRLSEAVEQLEKVRPEIMTLDLNLPGATGEALTDLIRKAKAMGNTRIIVISGHPEMMAGAVMTDIDLALTKPVDNNHLIVMIDRLLS
jgi:CheY-like chemotaxis protein